ncbi:MAG: hypothetical protein FRX48_06501 [Lasallia pustulata]|uniref:BZIP domain-containing protein n=1 Tax=Lasallia pustulata TaxID=136370 RepID=A0A5M8PLY7_9LECA|nr:MAG: hypothetical protein FRX48_06501 [Lasallia pustulata]
MAMISPVDSRMGSSGDGLSSPTGGNAYDNSDSAGSKSPLHMNLGFLKNLTEKKTTRDGQPPKRRGPKPDSKPALTRRQELNRQAQRTHRERKELYIKALEEQVMKLKETYSSVVQDKNAIAEENRKLKELLRLHGIAFPGLDQYGHNVVGGVSSYGGSSSGSRSGSYSQNQGFSPPTTVGSAITPVDELNMQAGGEVIGGPQSHQRHQQQGLDYDRIGIDFVLTLERPCMDHMQFLCVRSHQEPQEEISGHALMATCPPHEHIVNHPDVPYPHKTWDVPNPDLMKLLELSERLPLDGEITPIMALKNIRMHERFYELAAEDFERLKDDLKAKVRCYGFGAVLEEFEVRDALSSVFAIKLESYTAFP